MNIPVLSCTFLIFVVLLLGNGVSLDVYSSGEGGYMCIRIPVLVQSNNTLFALAEARGLHFKNLNCCVSPVQDYPWCNDKDIVLKTSTDGGNTWSSLRVLYETSSQYFFSNPTPVYDTKSNKFLMIVTQCEVATLYSNCNLFYTQSEDEMKTWSSLRPLPFSFLSPLGGPPSGIQLMDSRIAFPVHTHSSMNFVIFTDNSGETFHIGSQVPNTGGESQIVQLDDSSLLQQIRNMSSGGEHYFTYSHDNGITWTKADFLANIPNTNCQASILYANNKLYLSTIASSINGERANLTVYSSYDIGKSWQNSTLVYNGPSGYSSLLEIANGKVAVMYERGISTPYDFISLSFPNI